MDVFRDRGAETGGEGLFSAEDGEQGGKGKEAGSPAEA